MINRQCRAVINGARWAHWDPGDATPHQWIDGGRHGCDVTHTTVQDLKKSAGIVRQPFSAQFAKISVVQYHRVRERGLCVCAGTACASNRACSTSAVEGCYGRLASVQRGPLVLDAQASLKGWEPNAWGLGQVVLQNLDQRTVQHPALLHVSTSFKGRRRPTDPTTSSRSLGAW